MTEKMIEESIPVDDTLIHAEHGLGGGPPVVFLNGAFSTHRVWRGVLGQLGAGLVPVVFDMRGRGASGRSADYSLRALEADLTAVISRLSLERPVLVGWSLGAHVALRWAAAHPDACRGLVLVDGGYPFAWSGDAEAEQTRRIFRRQRWLLPLLARLGKAGRMTAAQHAEVVIELNERAPHLVEDYAQISVPINVIVASGGSRGAAAADVARMRASLTPVLERHPTVRVFRTVDHDHLHVLDDSATVVAAVDDIIART